MASRFVARSALLVLWLAAVMVCVAWLGGAIPHQTLPDPDYMWRPPQIASGLKLLIGMAATFVVVAVCLLLRRLLKQGVLSRTWLAVFVAAGAIAAYCGFTYVVATAPVIGANIGGGIAVLFAGPFTVGTAIVAGVWVHQGPRTPPA